ncbi:family 20 glycosylhydrolase [Inquilinus sp. KBS0705]|nr:family 20 glycosylhydrolase [Inquilinus sp. KBS0705]
MEQRLLKIVSALFIFLAPLNNLFAQPDSTLPIIPYPVSLVKGNGKFIVDSKTPIVIPVSETFSNEANELKKLFTPALGKTLKITHNQNTGGIIFKYDATVKQNEGYKLSINARRILISAKSASGAFSAVETMRQLLPASIETGKQHPLKLSLPALDIIDYPAYSWRGMHLDVSRHFFSIEYLRKFIDVMALYKMNKFHLHLTDDQGWRIEIKKYPKLTEQGAWRGFNNQDSICMDRAKENPDFEINSQHIIKKDGKTLYGGYYTQQQLKELVAYAAAKHIEIIPEIDMPGHMMAAISAYPFLSCDGSTNKWGKDFSQPICPCNQKTIEFVENVFKEVMDIFPSSYIHIGGDEVDRASWAQCESCKILMSKEEIKSLPALQNYFINHMERFFNQHGKKIIGWDEIIEGGISPTAILMYWRTWVPEAPVKAAKNGNKVIMTPGNPLYFDYLPDNSSIYNVYHFNPVPPGLNKEQSGYIIGAQANIWTEYIPSEKRAEYMYMPRMTALAERLWTNSPDGYLSYRSRLNNQYDRLDLMNIHYRLPDIQGLLNDRVFITTDTLNFDRPLKKFPVRFTTDGSTPTNASPELTTYIVNHTQLIKVAAFTPKGRIGDIYNIKYQQQDLANPIDPTSKDQGLTVAYYKGNFKKTAEIPKTFPDSSFKADRVDIPASVSAPSFGLKYKGNIEVPVDGIYTFYLTCDDGGVLLIAGRETVNNDGLHSEKEQSGQVALRKGHHKISLDFIEGGGGYKLKLRYSINGSSPTEIPPSWLSN